MKIAVAKDDAFNFIYRANIDALKNCAEVIFFSPLVDKELPDCQMLYLPGGYPELFAETLTGNISMRESIYQYAENGGRIFAECGGMMYLTQEIIMDGHSYPMCGVLPFQATMKDAHLRLGYRSIPTEEGTLKGHEFHYSEIVETEGNPVIATRHQLSAKDKATQTAIYRYKNVIAGYTHWYWAESGFEAFLKSFNAFA